MRDKSLLNKIISSSFGNFPKISILLQILSLEIPIIWFHGVYLYMKQKHQKQHTKQIHTKNKPKKKQWIEPKQSHGI